MNSRMRVLMPVYNEIDFDGRVQRAAQAIGRDCDVTVLSLDSGRGFTAPGFRSRVVRLPELKRFRGLMHLWFLARLCALAVRLRPALVHAHDFHMALPGWIAARLSGARVIYDAHELYIPEPPQPMSRHARFWYRLERWVIGRVDLVVAANPERAQVMREHFGLATTPLVVRNVSPLPERLLDDAALLGTYPQLAPGSAGSIRLVYQGDLNLQRGLGYFVDAMPRLDERFQLVVVGGGVDLEPIRARVEAQGLGGRVVFLGRVPRTHLPDILRVCDIGIITYAETGLNNLLCAPNKLYDYPQAGLPMVGRPNPVLDRVFAEHGVGATALDVREAVLAVAGDLEGYRARLDAFVRSHTWDVEAARLREGYARLGLGTGAPAPAEVHA